MPTLTTTTTYHKAYGFEKAIGLTWSRFFLLNSSGLTQEEGLQVENFYRQRQKRSGHNFRSTPTSQSLSLVLDGLKVSKSALKYHQKFDTEKLDLLQHLQRRKCGDYKLWLENMARRISITWTRAVFSRE